MPAIGSDSPSDWFWHSTIEPPALHGSSTSAVGPLRNPLSPSLRVLPLGGLGSCGGRAFGGGPYGQFASHGVKCVMGTRHSSWPG